MAMAQAHLRAITRAVETLERDREKLRAAIVAAYESGESIRDIAKVAHMSHQRVHQLIHLPR